MKLPRGYGSVGIRVWGLEVGIRVWGLEVGIRVWGLDLEILPGSR
jgi:hypothetical protein